MGTNYYWVKDKCSHCDRYDQRWHICKSFATFQAYRVNEGPNDESVDTWKRWKELILKEGFVCDEYGTWYEKHSFISNVETKYTEEERHRRAVDAATELMEHRGPQFHWGRDEYADPEGYYFLTTEFS